MIFKVLNSSKLLLSLLIVGIVVVNSRLKLGHFQIEPPNKKSCQGLDDVESGTQVQTSV